MLEKSTQHNVLFSFAWSVSEYKQVYKIHAIGIWNTFSDFFFASVRRRRRRHPPLFWTDERDAKDE